MDTCHFTCSNIWIFHKHNGFHREEHFNKYNEYCQTLFDIL